MCERGSRSASRHAVLLIRGPNRDHATRAQRGVAAVEAHELRCVLRIVLVVRGGRRGSGRESGSSSQCGRLARVVIVVVVRGAGWRWERKGAPLMFGISGHHRGGVCGITEGEHETEGILAVQIEAVETFSRDEAEGSVQPEGGHVVKLGLEHDLAGERAEVRLCSDAKRRGEEWKRGQDEWKHAAWGHGRGWK
jgi:hypothetical protein